MKNATARGDEVLKRSPVTVTVVNVKGLSKNMLDNIQI